MTAVPARSLTLFYGIKRCLSAVRGVLRRECHKQGASDCSIGDICANSLLAMCLTPLGNALLS